MLLFFEYNFVHAVHYSFKISIHSTFWVKFTSGHDVKIPLIIGLELLKMK